MPGENLNDMRNNRIQCGWEDECESLDCFNCPKMIDVKADRITLAEAICIEDFADVDLDMWGKENIKRRDLSQDIMRKLLTRLDW